jgi:putative hydrolase of the HAD superfamily
VRRCLLIDLDGVLRVWDPARDVDVEQRHSLPTGSLARAAFGDAAALYAAVTGRVTDEEWRAGVAARLSDLCGPTAHRVVAEWSESPGAVDPAVLAVVRSARRSRWRVGLLTNATTRLPDDLGVLGLEGELDLVLNSSELGVAKPDPVVFEEACRRMEVHPSECAFVDDSATNVAAAAAVGLDAHHYRDPRSLAAFLGLEPPTGG